MTFTKHILALFILLCCFTLRGEAQTPPWHGISRSLHYRPQGTDLVKVSGSRRFNRALYGGNTGFRVEAGDLPEFALYLPGMGGNLSFELELNGRRKRFASLDSIETIYRAGSMIYVLHDAWLGAATIKLSVLAGMESESILLKMETGRLPAGLQLLATYGGASGRRFSRDGDIGADPESSFDLQPAYCDGNRYEISDNLFQLHFTYKKQVTELRGIFPPQAQLQTAYFSPAQPYLRARISLQAGAATYYMVGNAATALPAQYRQLETAWQQADAQRAALAGRVTLQTPDSFINTLGGALSIAADAIYESPTYLHGAVAWRMRLNAWRGAYAADPLGWHDRAESHFSSYAQSQLTAPPDGPVIADTALGMARQLEKLGTSLFSEGYICRNPGGDFRPHHYDMNLVFIDQLLEHFKWTGDTAYMRRMWPLLKRHLAWEKRNFDADNDGLYDAYACIWASDALQYNGGAVTHSSAYNYKANLLTAQVALLLGEDPQPYRAEAQKIHNAIRLALWLPHLGSYAEYRDNTASSNLHAAAGLWTIYHAMDSGVPDEMQSWQALEYIDHNIPHIPVHATDLADTGLFVLSTTNWQPYTWSVNNVALAENLHTALAYWQGNRAETAFKLWKGALLESMLMGASPGNFGQLSFCDAMRGELYRDFADPIGVAARSLVEGLFGIRPNALDETLEIRPGFPESWDHAALHLPDIDLEYIRKGDTAYYHVQDRLPNSKRTRILLPAAGFEVEELTLDGKPVSFTWLKAVGDKPCIQINLPQIRDGWIRIRWTDNKIKPQLSEATASRNKVFTWRPQAGAVIREVKDPQSLFSDTAYSISRFRNRILTEQRQGTFFVKLEQDHKAWWQPVHITIPQPVSETETFSHVKSEPVDISAFYNAKVSGLLEQKYLSPRSPYPTLQLPVQGIGNWCYPKVHPVIDDTGFRTIAKQHKGLFPLANGTVFRAATAETASDIVFTSRWDNYPDTVSIPLSGKGRYLALLVAGTTNPMESQMENGRITVYYEDGTSEVLQLRNPGNWWPIEQDYYEDGYAFHLEEKPPLRVHLKDGTVYPGGFAADSSYTKLKGFSDRMIDGGAATVLYLKIKPRKALRSLTLEATASEVVIGLMGVSIINETK